MPVPVRSGGPATVEHAGDVTVVNLQHADGRTALERGQVDAWAGLDPYLSQSQIDNGSRLVYRNLDFNSFGFLNVSEKILADAAKIEPAFAAQQLTERTRFDISPVPGAAQTEVLERIAPLLASEHLVADEKDVIRALDTLFAPEFASKAAAS
jgi:sulfonate transport system substrate-binding protein